MREKGFDRLGVSCADCSTFVNERGTGCIKCLQKVTNMMLSDSELYKDAIHTWGNEAQFMVAIGEVGELLDALIKFWRGQTNEPDDIIDELSDVMLMSMQLAIVLGPEKIADRLGAKMDKIHTRLLNTKLDI